MTTPGGGILFRSLLFQTFLRRSRAHNFFSLGSRLACSPHCIACGHQERGVVGRAVQLCCEAPKHTHSGPSVVEHKEVNTHT